MGVTVKNSILKLLVLSCAFSLVTGCSADGLEGDSAEGSATADETATDAATNNTGNTGVSENWNPEVITRADGWLEVRPGGETLCSRGTDYAYFVRPGDPEKVVVEFQGGGACWDDVTCSVAGAIFSEDIEDTRGAVGLYRQGIYDHDNPDNPFAGWTHVMVPYCTGDVHWGNADTDYGSGEDKFTIHHRGYVNALSAIGWVQNELPDPTKIAVTGCSAGGYGSIVWSAWMMENYPEAKVLQFSDSAAGIITDQFFADSFPQWGVDKAFPAWIPELDLSIIDYMDLELGDVYEIIGNHYPQNRISQYNTLQDKTQVFYYEAMNGAGGGTGWTERMADSVFKIKEATPNFNMYMAGGDVHCTIPIGDFYTREVNGVRLVDWLSDYMEDDEAPEDVVCEDCL
jgi:hypothetical protein